MPLDEPALNPAQRDVLDRLGRGDGAFPEFAPDLRDRLRAQLEQQLAPLLGELDEDETVFLSKHLLSRVHGCEARYLAEERAGFTWSVPLARGTLAHKAIELTLNWRGEVLPTALVDEAMAKLEFDSAPVSEFLRTCTEVERAELRAQATDHVAKFIESFPPLSPKWRPVVESRIYASLLDDRITLQGRVDLTLGHAEGTAARKVIIDLKTGSFSPAHRDDLRFYALVETLRVGVPPRLVASYYLDAARPETEAVTEPLLQAAAARVAAGAERLVGLKAIPDTAVKRPGPPCRWCPIQAECAEGTAWIEERDDPAAQVDDDW